MPVRKHAYMPTCRSDNTPICPYAGLITRQYVGPVPSAHAALHSAQTRERTPSHPHRARVAGLEGSRGSRPSAPTRPPQRTPSHRACGWARDSERDSLPSAFQSRGWARHPSAPINSFPVVWLGSRHPSAPIHSAHKPAPIHQRHARSRTHAPTHNHARTQARARARARTHARTHT